MGLQVTSKRVPLKSENRVDENAETLPFTEENGGRTSLSQTDTIPLLEKLCIHEIKGEEILNLINFDNKLSC